MSIEKQTILYISSLFLQPYWVTINVFNLHSTFHKYDALKIGQMDYEYFVTVPSVPMGI